MLTRNLLKAGDYIQIVPLGVRVTLQYKSTGLLDKVWLGYEIGPEGKIDEEVHYSKNLYSSLIKKLKVPTHISTNNGSLFIYGVLYTGRHPKVLGNFEDSLQENIINDIVRDDCDFNFFACNVKSTSISFTGISQIRNWLKAQDFNLLPGLLAPLKDIEAAIDNTLQLSPFQYSLICGYFVSDKTSSNYVSLNKIQDKIKSLDVYLDKEGYVRCNLKLTKLDNIISISYYEMINKQLYENDLVVLDSSHNIETKYPLPENGKLDNHYTCPFCGKRYTVSQEFERCPDSHCISRLYSQIVHFLTKLNLPSIEYDRYIKLWESNKFTKFSDVLMLPELRDCEIETTFYNLFDAIIPVSSIRDRNVLWNFCIACNNSWESICYYLDHPSSIKDDLSIDSQQLFEWLQDKLNVETIKEIISYTNIIITPSSKKFEGSPIFRGRSIWLTGKFVHGSIPEIESILRSYSASITNTAKTASCGIIGDIPENIDGFTVNQLKARGIPVFSESEFFNKYDIDSDLN